MRDTAHWSQSCSWERSCLRKVGAPWRRNLAFIHVTVLTFICISLLREIFYHWTRHKPYDMHKYTYNQEWAAAEPMPPITGSTVTQDPRLEAGGSLPGVCSSLSSCIYLSPSLSTHSACRKKKGKLFLVLPPNYQKNLPTTTTNK